MTDMYIEGIKEDLEPTGFWMGPAESLGVVSCDNCSSSISLDITEADVEIVPIPERNKYIIPGDTMISFSWDCPTCNNWVSVGIELTGDDKGQATKKNGDTKVVQRGKRLRTKYKGARKVIPFRPKEKK